MSRLLSGIALCLGLSQIACAPSEPASPAVVVSVAPLAPVVREVAEPSLPVRVFLPAGRDPHTFDLRPGDTARLAGVRIAVMVGGGLDPWMERAVRAVGKNVAFLTLAGPDFHGDPHLWLDPAVVRGLVPALAESLVAAVPGDAAMIRARAADLDRELARLDRLLRERLEPVQGRAIGLQYPAFADFARRYGLHPVAILQPDPETEPSPRDLARSIERLREAGVPVIFSHAQAPDAAAAIAAREIGARVVALDPLGREDDAPGGLWRRNAELIREALLGAGD